MVKKTDYSEFFLDSQKIYRLLEDKLSRNIFETRIENNLTENAFTKKNVLQIASETVKNSVELFGKLANSIDIYQNETIIVYGAGPTGHFWKNKLNKYKTIIFCDRNFDKITMDNSTLIISPQELLERYNRCKIVVCAGDKSEEVYHYLIANNIDKTLIYLGSTIDTSEQYFDEIIKFNENEIFVDGGAYDAATAIQFAKKCNYKKIYLFEPDEHNCECIKDNLNEHKIEKTELIQAGLWKNETTLSFKSGLNQSSRLSESGDINVNVISLDKVFENRNELPTFIKMDIEGAELNALIGAKKIIQKSKPKLAISVYHKPEDIVSIAKFIVELVPQYKIFLRHYTSIQDETVLYAIVYNQ